MVASRNLLQQVLSLSEFYFRFGRFILLVQTKRVISINYGRSTSSWKPWTRVRLHLIFRMRYIFINSNLHPLTKFTSRSRSTEFKDILPSYNSQIITRIIPISTRVVIRYAVKRSIPLWVSQKINGNSDDNFIRISNWGKVIVEQIITSEEINKSKRAGHLRQINFNKSLPALSVPSEWVMQSLWCTLESPNTNILADGLIERISSTLDEIALRNRAERQKRGRWLIEENKNASTLRY